MKYNLCAERSKRFPDADHAASVMDVLTGADGRTERGKRSAKELLLNYAELGTTIITEICTEHVFQCVHGPTVLLAAPSWQDIRPRQRTELFR